MPRGNELSDFQKGQIITLHEDGYSNREVARILDISERSIRYNLEKFQTSGTMVNKPRSGRPRVTTEKEDRLLVRYSLEKRNAPEIRALFQENNQRLLSVPTVKK
ncbi:uncharacterized protein LOC144444373 [Glandiceps talaboti]